MKNLNNKEINAIADQIIAEKKEEYEEKKKKFLVEYKKSAEYKGLLKKVKQYNALNKELDRSSYNETDIDEVMKQPFCKKYKLKTNMFNYEYKAKVVNKIILCQIDATDLQELIKEVKNSL